MQYGDELIISDFSQLGKNSEQLAANILGLLYSGIHIKILNQNWSIDEKDFSVLIPILRAQVTMNQQKMKKAQRKGIEKSKSENRYQGRKKKEVDFIKLEESYKKFKLGKLTIEEAMRMAEIDSKSTYYRRIKELL